MDLQKLISVSGFPGLYKLAGTRNNGIIIEDLDNGKRRFVPARTHQFMPLEGIAIYTYTDSVPLKEVLQKMMANGAEKMPDPKDSPQTLRTYFTEILPDHDPDRVRTGDIIKIIKWYRFLETRGRLQAGEEEEE